MVLQLPEWSQQIALDIVVEGPEGGDVEDSGRSCLPGFRNELVERPEKRRERFPTAGGCRHQNMLSRRDPGPCHASPCTSVGVPIDSSNHSARSA